MIIIHCMLRNLRSWNNRTHTKM